MFLKSVKIYVCDPFSLPSLLGSDMRKVLWAGFLCRQIENAELLEAYLLARLFWQLPQ